MDNSSGRRGDTDEKSSQKKQSFTGIKNDDP